MYVATWLELAVASVIIALGLLTFGKALRTRRGIHFHLHNHNGASHIHVHFHERGTEHRDHAESHRHAIVRLGIKPFLVGGMHGLAGQPSLTLLLITQIKSTLLGQVYLLIFGLGPVSGMLVISGLEGLPFAGRSLARVHFGLQAMVGVMSVVFGLWYAYEISAGWCPRMKVPGALTT